MHFPRSDELIKYILTITKTITDALPATVTRMEMKQACSSHSTEQDSRSSISTQQSAQTQTRVVHSTNHPHTCLTSILLTTHIRDRDVRFRGPSGERRQYVHERSSPRRSAGRESSAVWDGRSDGAPTAQAGSREMQPGGGVPPVWWMLRSRAACWGPARSSVCNRRVGDPTSLGTCGLAK